MPAEYVVKPNRCNCHPETCGCNPWAIFRGSHKHSTHYHKEVAEQIAGALNSSIDAFRRGVEAMRDQIVAITSDIEKRAYWDSIGGAARGTAAREIKEAAIRALPIKDGGEHA
jgi:hypothetical protein